MIKEDSWWWMKMVMINIDENYPIWQANEAKMKIPKNPEIFSLIPGSKILENPVPKNPGIPGFGKIPSRKIPGLKFLIPLGPAHGQAITGSRESRDPGIFSWSKSRDFGKWNPGIFRDLLVEWKWTFYGPQCSEELRTHLKIHSGEKSNATNMYSCRRFQETF